MFNTKRINEKSMAHFLTKHLCCKKSEKEHTFKHNEEKDICFCFTLIASINLVCHGIQMAYTNKWVLILYQPHDLVCAILCILQKWLVYFSNEYIYKKGKEQRFEEPFKQCN